MSTDLLDPGCLRIAQRPGLASGDRVRQREGVTAEHIDVLVPERRQSGDILRPGLVTFGTELVHGCVHVDRVPEHDEVDDQPEYSKLILLSPAVALAKFAALTVENDAYEGLPRPSPRLSCTRMRRR